MSRITGTLGEVKIGAVVVGSVTEFNLEQTQDMVPDDVLGDLNKNFLPDRTGWTGSMTVGYDKDDTAQTTLRAAIASGASLDVHLIPAGDTTGNIDFNGSVYLTALSMPTAAGAIVTQAFSAQGTGALAETTIPI